MTKIYVKMNFDQLISNLNVHVVSNAAIQMHISLLVQNGHWTELRRTIKLYSEHGEKVWLQGYDLLDYAAKCRNPRLVFLLVNLFSSLRLVVENNSEFPLLKFIFYYAIEKKDRLLIDSLVSIGVSVNDPLDCTTGYPLCVAISKNAGLDIIRSIIDHGACVNGGKICLLKTPLGVVIGCPPSDLVVAELLFVHGADVNAGQMCSGPTSNTLIHLACAVSNNEGLQWLLSHDADPNVQSDSGATGLHTAVLVGDLASVKTLLEYGVVLNTHNQVGKTPLLSAVEINSPEIAELLLQHGAEFCNATLSAAFRKNIVTFDGPNNSCAQQKIFDILKNYGFLFDINIVKSNDLQLIHTAARNGHFWIVKTYLESGGSPDSIYADTPLLYEAVTSKNKDLVEFLLDYGPDTSYENLADTSALTISVISNSVEITELLLSNGHNDFSDVCVFIAADNLNVDMLEVLFKFGVNVNVRDDQCMTPLHFAILSNKHVSRCTGDIDLEKVEVVKCLLNHGASIISWNRNSGPVKHPVIHLAISFNYVQVVKVLLEADSSFDHFEKIGSKLFPSTLLHFAIKYKSSQMVTALLEKGAPVDALQFDNKTPLQIAVESHAWHVVQVLLAHGANVRSTTSCNQDLVFYAVESSSPKVVDELLKFGADVDSRGHHGVTALQKACHLGNGDVVAVLLDHGADISAEDCVGNTPFTVLKKTSLAMRIVAQGNWFGYQHGKAVAGPSTPLYHLQRHAFKMNLVGFPLHPCFKPFLELQYSNNFIKSCMEELEFMKTCKISGSCLRLYDVIRQKNDPAYVYNKSVTLSLHGNDQWENVALFRGILKSWIKKAKLRSKLLDSGQKRLSDLLNFCCLNYLPNEIIRKIISLLKHDELLIISELCNKNSNK